MRKQQGPIEIDCPVDVDDLAPGTEVRVLLQKCPHCGEWTAGPLGDDERYFCCGEAMDPFVEAAGEVEIVGKVARVAGGGRDLREMVDVLTDEDRRILRDRWMAGQAWIPVAEELYKKRREERPAIPTPTEVVWDILQPPPKDQ